MIYIYAVGLNKRGGLKVLNYFLNINKVYYFLDIRLANQIKKNKFITFHKHDIISRYINLVQIKIKLKKNDHIIFLNGLPPIIKFNCKVSVLFQNANIIPNFYHNNFINFLISRDFLRYIIFFFGSNKVDDWIVLSRVSKKILKAYLNNYNNVKVLDIFSFKKKLPEINSVKLYDFIYPADLKNHKNHDFLLEVFIELSKNNCYPSLLLTLSKEEIKNGRFNYYIKKYGLDISFIVDDDYQKFQHIYQKCKALLYVSKKETIGLPIIEAWQNNLFIIAPNINYAYQFITPDVVYHSKHDLVEIIKKFKNEKLFSKKSIDKSEKILDFGDFDLNTYKYHII